MKYSIIPLSIEDSQMDEWDLRWGRNPDLTLQTFIDSFLFMAVLIDLF